MASHLASRFGSVLFVAFGLWGCGGTETASFTLRIGHDVDGQALVFDDVRYTNAAGNAYSVERLEYYVSGVRLHRADGSTVELTGTHYCSARDATTNTLPFASVPTGTYTGVTIRLGLDATQNVTGALPATTQNTNMAWPVPMGGGYHFLKLEGRFRDGAGALHGYAMHIGRTTNAITARVDTPIVVRASGSLALRMNLNEWFNAPSRYDFATDPVYSMSSDAAMRKLAANGVDVLSAVAPQ